MSNMKKKVVIITDAPSLYRVELFMYLQENYDDYEFSIIFCNKSSRQWDVPIKKLNSYCFLSSLKIKYPTKLDHRFLVISHGISKILDRIQPDVIVASEYNQSVQTAFTWARIHRKKFVSWTDGTIRSEKDFKGIRIFLRKRIIRKADSFIASSSSSKELQIKYGANKEKIHVSFLTVKTDAYAILKEKNEGPFQILFVGRLVKGKGLHLLIETLKNVRGNYKLIVAGDGPERDNLEKLAEAYGIRSKIKFTGFLQREQLTKYYATSQLFVLPTLNDCFGLVILEAMCAKLPVITTIYADGAPDLIENNKSGIILDPNDKDEFTAAIQRFIDDSEYATRVGFNGFDRTEIFNFRNVSKGFMAAIDDSLGGETNR